MEHPPVLLGQIVKCVSRFPRKVPKSEYPLILVWAGIPNPSKIDRKFPFLSKYEVVKSSPDVNNYKRKKKKKIPWNLSPEGILWRGDFCKVESLPPRERNSRRDSAEVLRNRTWPTISVSQAHPPVARRFRCSASDQRSRFLRRFSPSPSSSLLIDFFSLFLFLSSVDSVSFCSL